MDRKVALVTGAATGIGASSAVRLAQVGMAVGVLDLDAERCADTVQAIEACGGEALALGADITNRALVKKAIVRLSGNSFLKADRRIAAQKLPLYRAMSYGGWHSGLCH